MGEATKPVLFNLEVGKLIKLDAICLKRGLSRTDWFRQAVDYEISQNPNVLEIEKEPPRESQKIGRSYGYGRELVRRMSPDRWYSRKDVGVLMEGYGWTPTDRMLNYLIKELVTEGKVETDNATGKRCIRRVFP